MTQQHPVLGGLVAPTSASEVVSSSAGVPLITPPGKNKHLKTTKNVPFVGLKNKLVFFQIVETMLTLSGKLMENSK